MGRKRLLVAIGQCFDRLTVVSSARNAKGWILYNCRCLCGNPKTVGAYDLKHRRVRSCGCLHRELCWKRLRTHGMSGSPEHRAWKEMIRRCYAKTRPGYKQYGGRGIRVCSRWRKSSTAFLRDVGPKPSPQHWLDRVNNDRNYEPGNVKWSTRSESANNKQQSVWMTYNGLTLTMLDWSKRLRIKYSTIRARRRRGWTDEEALSIPSSPGKWLKTIRMESE
jgi:hypothetical protein